MSAFSVSREISRDSPVAYVMPSHAMDRVAVTGKTDQRS